MRKISCRTTPVKGVACNFFSFLAVTKDSQADFSSDLFSFTRLLSLFYKGNWAVKFTLTNQFYREGPRHAKHLYDLMKHKHQCCLLL